MFQYTHLKLWEFSQDGSQFVMNSLLCILDFPHIETTNSADLKTLVNDSWSLALCLRQHYIDEVL